MVCLKAKGKSAFTLIELLVVIAIISILAAILFPVFASAREKARQASCSSNEKQMGVAFLQYVQDFDETFPQHGGPSYAQTFNLGNGWAGQIYPYVKSTGVFTCPDDPSVNTAFANTPHVNCSYAYNFDIPNGQTAATAPAYTGTTKVGVAAQASLFTSPAKTVVLCEICNGLAFLGGSTIDTSEMSNQFTSESTNGWDISEGGASGVNGYTLFMTGYMGNRLTQVPGQEYAGQFYAGPGAPSTPNAGPTGYHTKGSNFLFADGHVKWLRGEQVSTGYNAYSPNDNQGSSSLPGDAWAATRAAGTQSSQGASAGSAPFVGTFSPT